MVRATVKKVGVHIREEQHVPCDTSSLKIQTDVQEDLLTVSSPARVLRIFKDKAVQNISKISLFHNSQLPH